MREYITDFVPGDWPSWVAPALMLAGIALLACLTYYLCLAVLRAIEKVVGKTSTTWDDDLLNRPLLRAVAQLAPALMVNWLLPNLLGSTPGTYRVLSTVTSFYILWAIIRVLTITIDNLYEAIAQRPKIKAYAVKGIFQMVKLIIIGVGVIVGLSMLIGKTPLAILTALGASAAVLMLVFQDTILGLVASVQLTANRMLHRGDWVVVPGQDANGEVVDISLTTVKVRNWDNSITTIPPYQLISKSFRNYQPMRRSGGRRVSRSIYIDVNTVRFLSAEETALLVDKGFIDAAEAGEREVNLRLLRRYLERWLENHPLVNHKMLTMVRQMEPTPSGLPLELYFFTVKTDWKEFEHVMSDVFDHVYASIGEFGLRIFQTPAGRDLEGITH